MIRRLLKDQLGRLQLTIARVRTRTWIVFAAWSVRMLNLAWAAGRSLERVVFSGHLDFDVTEYFHIS